MTLKYLFFDLEYANSKGGINKICEFGYVITNENFDVIKKGNFIIDPYINRNEWDWRVVRKILTRKVSKYEHSPRFDEYYLDMKNMIENADYVFGHSLDGDAKALNDDCKRYNLGSINFNFYDIKLFYKSYKNSKNETSVTNILNELNIDGDRREHDAEADAFNTMLELKKMLEELNCSLSELIILCPEAKNKNENYEVESIVVNQKIKKEKFARALSDIGDNTLRSGQQSYKCFLQFLDNVQPQDGYEKKLLNKKISISINYEEYHYKQMLNIVQLLCNYGAIYVMKASRANIFVSYDVLLEDGTPKLCSKTKYVNQANAEGASIEIITFDNFMRLLGITEIELDKMPMVSFECLYRDDAVIKNKETLKILGKHKKEQEIKQEKISGTALGDMFPDYFFELSKNLEGVKKIK